MSTLSAKRVVEILGQYDRSDHVQPSARAGQIRIADINNDVTCAIELMGGIASASKLLGATEDEVNRWIDEHFVPQPFAMAVRTHTGYSVWSLQQPTFYVSDGEWYWPHRPTPEEFLRSIKISVYRHKASGVGGGSRQPGFRAKNGL